jgi:hypothetical protein
MSDTTPSFEHSFPGFVIPNTLDGLEISETQREQIVFNGLGSQIQRVQAMGDPSFKNFSFFNGWNQDGHSQAARFSNMHFGKAAGHHVIVNEVVTNVTNHAAGDKMNIWDFMVDVSRFHIAVHRTSDARPERNWNLADESGPHLFFRGASRLNMVSGKTYEQPVLEEPRTELSERMRRTMIASELVDFLKGLHISTREDNAHF